MSDARVWGVHMGRHVGDAPIERGYVAIGWPEMGDLSRLEPSREAFKARYAEAYPDAKPGAVPIDAGTMFKFLHEIRDGDVVVYPSKEDRLVNIGRVGGPHRYAPDDPHGYPDHRPVEWLAAIPRSDLSQTTLSELGSYMTLFRVRRGAAELLSKAGLTDAAGPVEPTEEDDEAATDEVVASSVSRQASETTADFIIRRLMDGVDGHRFEHVVADLLRVMGYEARVTPASADGGVDVIAHRDVLGFEPPILKVQCKRTTSQTGRPDVDRLLGTLGDGEVGLFVNLGSYARTAIELERNRAKLRLIDGEDFVALILRHYDDLPARWRSLIPLKRIHVPDLRED